MEKMIRKPSYSGKADQKDELDILFWAYEKTPFERLIESWKLNCINNNISINTRMVRSFTTAVKR